MLVFLYSPERPDKNNNKDFYREVKQAALLLSKKHKKVSKKTPIKGTIFKNIIGFLSRCLYCRSI
jgi:hypothetical protein